jgi:predicted component of type VI protein secretion system
VKKSMMFFAVCLTLIFYGCSSQHKVEVQPMEIKPIHITIDVNVRVEKALDDFFSDIDAAEKKIELTKEKKQ